MTSTTYVRLRDIPLPVLEIIRSSRRGEDISRLLEWGAETGSLSQEVGIGQRITRLHLQCDNCAADTDKMLYEVRKALKQGSRDAYCSAECSQSHHAIKNTKPCEICGKPKAYRHGRYCGDTCKAVGAQRRRKLRACPRCGTQFGMRVMPSGYKMWTVYCSAECADADHADRMRGSGNSNFKRLGKYSNLYAQMRDIILERDDHQCVACAELERSIPWGSQVRTNLHIHHIDEDTHHNDPENLITLCQPCHSKHHVGTLALSPTLSALAASRSASMTSRLRGIATSLLMEFSSTTAS